MYVSRIRTIHFHVYLYARDLPYESKMNSINHSQNKIQGLSSLVNNPDVLERVYFYERGLIITWYISRIDICVYVSQSLERQSTDPS